MIDNMCLACLRPRSEHRLTDNMCPVDTYFIEHVPTKAELAAPDLVAELIDLRRRFHNACRAAGSDEEFVLGSTPGADAALAKAGVEC
jgi:hypothetical protein